MHFMLFPFTFDLTFKMLLPNWGGEDDGFWEFCRFPSLLLCDPPSVFCIWCMARFSSILLNVTWHNLRKRWQWSYPSGPNLCWWSTEPKCDIGIVFLTLLTPQTPFPVLCSIHSIFYSKKKKKKPLNLIKQLLKWNSVITLGLMSGNRNNTF